VDLILIRHAAAVSRDEAGAGADAERALTKEGKREFEAGTLAILRAADWRFDRLLHSPWRRAEQTAALLAPLCEHEPEATAGLAAPPRAEFLLELSGGRVAAVGHQPWLGELAALLCLGRSARGLNEKLVVGKGAALWLRGDLSPGGMRLRALWPRSPRP
jgi:phosphohistidine phosphatase